MKISITNIALSTFLSFLLVGCISNDYKTTSPLQGPDQKAASIKMNSIVFIDHSLNKKTTRSILGFEYFTEDIRVSVQRSGIRPSPTGQAEVWVMLKNHSSSAVQVEGRVQFFDQDKAPSEDMTAWQRVYVPAYGTVAYKELAINRGSSYYQIEFREGM